VLKFALLGLLHRQPRHGYDLKHAFERLVGGTWMVNIGQIYTTLARLERDGFVQSELVEQDPRPDRKVFSLTDAGEKELRRWLERPAEEPIRLKDELFLKVLVSDLAGEDITDLVWSQRQRYLDSLADLTELQTRPGVEQPTLLLLEGAILHLQADLAWLDRCEDVLASPRRLRRPRRT
jgi:DNA-binding PadR family transcriptional regulator